MLVALLGSSKQPTPRNSKPLVTVPFQHSVKLHAALQQAGIPSTLIKVPGGAHGRHTWSDSETLRVRRAIEAFLRARNVLSGGTAR